MAFVTGKNSLVLYNASDISAFLNQFEVGVSGEAHDTTCFAPGVVPRTFIPGLKNGEAALQGKYDGLANQIGAILWATLNTDGNVVTLSLIPSTIGNACWLISAPHIGFTFDTKVSGLVTIQSALQPDDTLGYGFYHKDLAAIAGPETSNGTSIDNTVATTVGGFMHLHVTAYSGSGAITFEIEDSADDAAWANLKTFASVSGVTQERVEITGTIRRYTRAKWTIPAGVTSVTFAIAMSRS